MDILHTKLGMPSRTFWWCSRTSSPSPQRRQSGTGLPLPPLLLLLLQQLSDSVCPTIFGGKFKPARARPETRSETAHRVRGRMRRRPRLLAAPRPGECSIFPVFRLDLRVSVAICRYRPYWLQCHIKQPIGYSYTFLDTKLNFLVIKIIKIQRQI